VVALAGAAGLGVGITVALAIAGESSGSLAAPGGLATAAGRLTGLAGTYLMLITVLLVARLPVLERAIGQDRLVRWHRRIGPWPLFLIAAHGALIVVGYAAAAKTGVLHQFGTLLWSYPGVLAATVGAVLLFMAGLTSYRIARRRMSHETWWAVHLYTYLALALAFSHQIGTGQSFVGHPLTRFWWTAMWLATAGVALVYRVGLPLWRSVLHGLRVVEVREDSPGVVSLICKGRRLERLPLAGGQFLQWRFLKRGMWWQAHPYSASGLVRPPYMRVTVKDLGDHSRALATLEPGTRIAIEGPYGAFTAASRRGDAVLLVGAGVGATPLRALLEDLPRWVDVVVLMRAHTREELVLGDEIAALVEDHGGKLYELLGPRAEVRLDAAALTWLVPDLAERDVFVCGPEGFTEAVKESARAAGIPRERIHEEAFAF
jgi:ferredoxin-NADP reductase/DMSO/TMAO reductase YedYZ heme-binding membrane subunit